MQQDPIRQRELIRLAVDQELGGRSEEWEAFRLEHRGIDYVPASDRHAAPLRLLWMWSGTTLNVLVFVYGSLLVAVFGLSLTQAILVSILGTFGGYTLLAAGSLAGPQAGTSQLVVSRAAFGLNWNRVNALCNWLLVVGYEVADLAIIVLAGLAIFHKAGVGSSPGLKVALILVAVAIQLPLPLYGHATVLKVMRPLAIVLAVFFVVMTILAATKIHLPAHQAAASWGSVTEALALTLSGGGLGWVAYGSDYTRYVPKAADKAKVFWYVLLGAAIPQSLLMVLGAVVTTALPAASDEISGLPTLFPGWFVVPYLLLAI
ncbi:MAG: purine-cytosine permease family protein, partial [Acidimicrobiales bacterium]